MSRAGCILPLFLQGKEGIARHGPGLCVGLQPLLRLLPLSHCFQYSLRKVWYLIRVGGFPVVNRDQLSAGMQRPVFKQLLRNVCELAHQSRSAWPAATLERLVTFHARKQCSQRWADKAGNRSDNWHQGKSGNELPNKQGILVTYLQFDTAHARGPFHASHAVLILQCACVTDLSTDA